ncbi:MAG TPA: hypothetical protein VMG99_03185 [Thermoplasmata archaeon]|nr:hypothetical protein [Thermoplasmata archaeon]
MTGARAVPLILDPDAYEAAALAALRDRMLEGLAEVEAGLAAPRGNVLDPAGIELARELVRAARAAVGKPGASDRARRAAEVNLAYAAMLAAIDLQKCHTDVPRVPSPRKGSPAERPGAGSTRPRRSSRAG